MRNRKLPWLKALGTNPFWVRIISSIARIAENFFVMRAAALSAIADSVIAADN